MKADTVCNHPQPDLCKLLGRHIHGRLWEIWSGKVLTPEKCESYRRRWLQEPGVDQLPAELEPGAIQRGINFGKAVVRDLVTGRKRASQALYEQRLQICNGCSLLTDRRVCSHMNCGCPIDRKARWLGQTCPAGMWPAIH